MNNNQIRCFVLMLFSILTMGCKSEKSEIIGIISDSYIGKIYLSRVFDTITVIDSSEVKDGKFYFNYPIEQTDIYILTTPDNSIYQTLALSKGSKMSVDLCNVGSPVIKVTEGAEQIAKNRIDTLLYSYHTDLSLGKTDFGELNKRMIEALVPDSKTIAAIYAANELLALRPEEYILLYSTIDTVSFAHSYYFKTLKQKYIKEKERYLVGAHAPDFTAKDLSGKEFRLSDFRGKYLYLDFWASWCHSCRDNNRLLVAKYETIPKELVVISFSMDDNRSLWAEASKKDGLKWLNLSDLKGIKHSEIGSKYRFVSLPAVYIINPEGIVVAQDVEIDKIGDYIK